MNTIKERELIKRVIFKYTQLVLLKVTRPNLLEFAFNHEVTSEVESLTLSKYERRQLGLKLTEAFSKAELALKHESESFKRKALSEYVIDYMFYKPVIEADDDDDEDELFYKDDE